MIGSILDETICFLFVGKAKVPFILTLLRLLISNKIHICTKRYFPLLREWNLSATYTHEVNHKI